MGEQNYQKQLGGLYDDEDTNETDLASKFFLWRWYRNTTRGLGQSKTFFMPLATAALASLAFFFGFPALENMVELLLELTHSTLAGFGRDDILLLHQRRAAAPVFAGVWAIAATFVIIRWAVPLGEEKDPLKGYVLPGSGILARLWAVVGKRLYLLRQALSFLFSYIRDLNLLKVHMPLSLLLLLALALVGLAHGLENILLELPARWAQRVGPQGWIPTTAWTTSAIVIIILGWSILGTGLIKAHRKSVKARERKASSWWALRLKGALSLIFVTLPLAWMTLFLLAGRLD